MSCIIYFFFLVYPTNWHDFGFSLQRCSFPFFYQNTMAWIRKGRLYLEHCVIPDCTLFSFVLSSALCLIIFICVFPWSASPLCSTDFWHRGKYKKKEVMYSLCNSFNLISSDLTSWSLCNEVDCTIPMHLDEKTMESNHILVWNLWNSKLPIFKSIFY